MRRALPRRYGRAASPLKAGQRVTVDMGRRRGIQRGFVTAIHPDGSFSWDNDHGIIRRATPDQITTAAPHAGKLDPYVQAWVDEGDGDE